MSPLSGFADRQAKLLFYYKGAGFHRAKKKNITRGLAHARAPPDAPLTTVSLITCGERLYIRAYL